MVICFDLWGRICYESLRHRGVTINTLGTVNSNRQSTDKGIVRVTEHPV